MPAAKAPNSSKVQATRLPLQVSKQSRSTRRCRYLTDNGVQSATLLIWTTELDNFSLARIFSSTARTRNDL